MIGERIGRWFVMAAKRPAASRSTSIPDGEPPLDALFFRVSTVRERNNQPSMRAMPNGLPQIERDWLSYWDDGDCE
jgi:hypothetical protein